MTNLIMDKGPLLDRVAVIKEASLQDLFIEEKTEERLVGNIYKGRVVNVLPGMQAAFVDIGHRKNGYLYIKDAIPFDQKRDGFKDKRIQDYVKAGQELFVQVIKPPIEDKGPRLTTNLSITGRYSVVSPMDQFVGVSKKINDGDKRKALKKIAKENVPQGIGCVIRTEAGRVDEDLISKDLNYLIQVWNRIKREAHLGKTPRLIHQDLTLHFRVLRDSIHGDVDTIKVNDELLYEELKRYLKHFMPTYEERLLLSEDGPLIFENQGVENQIEQLMQPLVPLSKGGSLIIEETKALTSIDVNSGRYVGNSQLEATILETNLKAAHEAMRQIRLRNISGIIVIDFIDMSKKKQRKEVMDVLKKVALEDTMQVDVLGFTQLGLLELSRKKSQNSLQEITHTECPVCRGIGQVASETQIANRLLKEVERIAQHTNSEAAVFQIDSKTHTYLERGSVIRIEDIEQLYEMAVTFDIHENAGSCYFKLKFMGRKSDVGKFTK